MNADAMVTRMAVHSRALPSRILLVDDDDLELELMADRLSAAGFEIARAANGEEALALLKQQWYPLIITDWQMPVMDGIAFTEALREGGATDTYIIMLTMREASVDYERGYVAGVDDYLSKRVPDAELFARISAGFNTLALRRSLKDAQAALEQAAGMDAESGAFALHELYSKLHAEIKRARRYDRKLTVLTLSVRAQGTHGAAALPAAVLRGVVQTVDKVVRSQIDWVGRLEAAAGAAFAIVLPEAGVTEAPRIKERLSAALLQFAETVKPFELAFAFGAAAIEDTGIPAEPDAAQMVEIATHCRGCPGGTSPEQLIAVQRSVTCRVAIVCRHGYVVESECSLKAQAAERNALHAAQEVTS